MREEIISYIRISPLRHNLPSLRIKHCPQESLLRDPHCLASHSEKAQLYWKRKLSQEPNPWYLNL
jgi:hypothetical protein